MQVRSCVWGPQMAKEDLRLQTGLQGLLPLTLARVECFQMPSDFESVDEKGEDTTGSATP